MLRLRAEGRMDMHKALDFLTRVTILSHPLRRDAAFGISEALQHTLMEAGLLGPPGAPRPPQQGGGGGNVGGGGKIAVPLGPQAPTRGGATTLIDLGLARLLRRLAHDETACYLVYRGNEWIGDVRCVRCWCCWHWCLGDRWWMLELGGRW